MPNKTETNPLYAVAGAADLAVAALRELPARMPAIAERAAGTRDRLLDRVVALPAVVDRRRAELPEELRALREEFPTVLHDVQVRAQRYAENIAGTYAELAARGETAVGRFRHEHATTLDSVTSRVAESAERAAEAADRFADGIGERRENGG